MLSHDNTSPSKRYKVMTEQQFEEVVTAILDGKYSWACVLILKFAGYNPLYYIPHRTYTRLKKENSRKDIDHSQKGNQKILKEKISDFPISGSKSSRSERTEIRDLSYLEETNHDSQKVRGRGVEIDHDSWIEASSELSTIKRLYIKMTHLFSSF